MALWEGRWTRVSGQVSVVGIMLAVCLAGCEPKHPSLEPTEKTTAGAPAENAATSEKPVPADSQLEQPFVKATRSEPPADWQRPPDLTLTAKPVGTLYTAIGRLWDTIHFTTKTGKPIQYTAVLDTELGLIEI